MKVFINSGLNFLLLYNCIRNFLRMDEKKFQFSSVAQSCLTLHRIAARQASLSITNSRSSLRLMSIESVMPSSHLILCRPLLLLLPIPPSIRVFSNESTLHMRSHGVSASTSVLPMNTQDLSPLGWTGWIFFQSKGLSRVFSNTTVQKQQFFGAAFFMLQLSRPYMTPGKSIALTRQTFVGRVMSLFSNMLLVTAFLPRNKHLLISWLQSPSAVILEPF